MALLAEPPPPLQLPQLLPAKTVNKKISEKRNALRLWEKGGRGEFRERSAAASSNVYYTSICTEMPKWVSLN